MHWYINFSCRALKNFNRKIAMVLNEYIVIALNVKEYRQMKILDSDWEQILSVELIFFNIL